MRMPNAAAVVSGCPVETPPDGPITGGRRGGALGCGSGAGNCRAPDPAGAIHDMARNDTAIMCGRTRLITTPPPCRMLPPRPGGRLLFRRFPPRNCDAADPARRGFSSESGWHGRCTVERAAVEGTRMAGTPAYRDRLSVHRGSGDARRLALVRRVRPHPGRHLRRRDDGHQGVPIRPPHRGVRVRISRRARPGDALAASQSA